MPTSPPYLHKVGSLIRTPEVTFRVEQNLGYGGMGEAHRVKNRMLNDDQLVLKVMHPEFARDPEARENFAWEARVGRKIKHENLARVEWLGNLDDADKTPYFLMEYVDGKTLRNTLREVAEGRLDVEQALTISAQMLRGLGALHERGIVHQDMKPSNIMLCRGPHGDLVKLIDLGVMRVLSVHGDSRTWAGTPPYSAREQIVGEPVGAWTDLFAVSVILFEMLTGETPYAKYGGSPAGAIARMNVEAPSLATYGSFVAALVALVAKGLMVRSEDRFRTASEMETALEKVLRGLQSADPHEAVTRPTLAGPPREGEEQGELGAVQLAGPTNEMNLDELHQRMGLDAAGAPPASALESGPPGAFSVTKPSGFGQHLSDTTGTSPVAAENPPVAAEPRMAAAPRADAARGAAPLAAVPALGMAGARRNETEPLARAPIISVLDAVTAPNPNAPLSAPASDGRVQYVDRRFTQRLPGTPTPSPVEPRVAAPSAPHPLPTLPKDAPSEPLLTRLRAKLQAFRAAGVAERKARRERSAVLEKEKVEAAKRKQSAKALARADRVEQERVARVAREAAREQRVLAEQQREVVENRRRIREADARGERWSGPATSRASHRVLLILVAVLGAVLVLLFLSVPAVQRRLGWQSAATPQLPAARSGQ